MAPPIKRIGVYTSGGDAPGMNACIRAVVRIGLDRGLKVTGIRRGYTGMIEGDFFELEHDSVSSLLQQGGTILKSTRSRAFRTPEGRTLAAEQLRRARIDALIAIGGQGTFKGATIFHKEHGVPVVGCPGTIDNDLYGTDETIGHDTALNTAIQNIDRVRDSADAHNRLFLIEVMGRDTGFIALHCGIAGGAELILIPEYISEISEIKKRIYATVESKTRSCIVVVAEGKKAGGAVRIAEAIRQDPTFDPIELRVCILGHTQRGGAPSARDRVLASRFGAAAVTEALLKGHTNVMVGLLNNQIRLTPLEDAWRNHKTINYNLLELAEALR